MSQSEHTVFDIFKNLQIFEVIILAMRSHNKFHKSKKNTIQQINFQSQNRASKCPLKLMDIEAQKSCTTNKKIRAMILKMDKSIAAVNTAALVAQN